MDDALDLAYRRTDYRVRLGEGGFCSIRIDEPLPPALAMNLAPRTPWAFLTAWNPRSILLGRTDNRLAQRALLGELKVLKPRSLRAGLAVGADDWREPGLFVAGLEWAVIDDLGHAFHQNAVVRGRTGSLALLHWLTH